MGLQRSFLDNPYRNRHSPKLVEIYQIKPYTSIGDYLVTFFLLLVDINVVLIYRQQQPKDRYGEIRMVGAQRSRIVSLSLEGAQLNSQRVSGSTSSRRSTRSTWQPPHTSNGPRRPLPLTARTIQIGFPTLGATHSLSASSLPTRSSPRY